ncbi:MAG: hypothetical protein IJF16_08950, partial [Clostridia bacterium]|nr:hypothetical protein [Clostridia bacterium]
PPKRTDFLYRNARLSHVISWDMSGVSCHALITYRSSAKYQPGKGAGCRSPPFRLDPANHPTRRKEIPSKADIHAECNSNIPSGFFNQRSAE